MRDPNPNPNPNPDPNPDPNPNPNPPNPDPNPNPTAALDYCAPLSAMQAFAIAMTSFSELQRR